MPYKNKEKATQASKERMRKHRQGVTEGVTTQGVTGEGVTTKEGIEMVPAWGILPERPRYLTLSDGQVLDRARPPKAKPQSGGFIARMQAANKAAATIIDPVKAERYRLWREGFRSSYRPIIEAIANEGERAKLKAICDSLKRHNVLDRVYYGCGRDPMLMSEVAELLPAFT